MDDHNSLSKRIGVCHVAHGDLWAGAEVQLAILLDSLVRNHNLECSAVLFNEGRLADELRKAGVRVTVFSEDKYNWAQLLIRLVQYFKCSRPDIIHTHKYKDNILGCCAAAIAGMPSVVRVVHGLTEPFTGRKYFKMVMYDFLDRVAMRWKVNRLIAVSSNIETDLCRIYGPHQVTCIHNGINLKRIRITQDRHTLRDGLGIGSDEYLLGTIGRLTPVKGHAILIQTAWLLKEEKVNCKLLIVGDGPLMSELKRLAQTLGVEKEVILAGQREDVYDLINAMDIFLLPSLHEGIPMVVLESLALGRPVVATRVGGIPEIICHGKEGLLVEPGSPQELKGSIRTLLEDRNLALKLAEAGRRRVEEAFTGDLMAARTARLYSALAPGRV